MTRGDIWWADLRIPLGSEPGYRRPVLIIQAESFNRSRIRTVLCVPTTTTLRLADAPGNVYLRAAESGLRRDSVVLVAQLICIDRGWLTERVGTVMPRTLADVEAGIQLVLAL